MKVLSAMRRFDVSSLPALGHDLGRFAQMVDDILAGLPARFRERLAPATGVITSATVRPALAWGRVNVIDASGGNINAYLPFATPNDAGRVVTIVKTSSAGSDLLAAVTIHPAISQLVNKQSAYCLIGQGVTELHWDGRYWWSPELPGQPRYHDASFAPVGLWQLDNTSWLDSSGHGRTLTTETGTPGFTSVMGLSVRWFDGAFNVYRNSADTALRMTGDATFEAIIVRADTTNRVWLSHGANGELEADNDLYNIQSGGTSTTYIHEQGAGTNETVTQPWPPALGCLTHFALVRQSNVISMYFNADLFTPVSSALNAPTGGSSGRFRIGANPAATSYWLGGVCSVKVHNVALSQAQINRDYNYTLGPLYGYV